MKNIGFIANPCSIHDCKWINRLSIFYNVIVICPPFNKKNSFLDKHIETYEILPNTFPIKNFLKRWYHLFLLKKLVIKKDVDIIHSMYAYPNSFWPDLIKFKNHIITTRGSDILVDYTTAKDTAEIDPTSKYFLNLFNQSFNNAKSITSTSYKQMNVINSFVSDNQKTSVIRTGIDVSKFYSILEIQNKDFENELLFFSPRSMKPIYNIDIIIDAYFEIKDQIPQSKLALINDSPGSPYSESILTKINQLNLTDSIIVLPSQTSDQMIYWYKNSSAVISIPNSDGTPNSVLEAMLAKRNIVIGNYDYDQDLFSNLNQLNTNSKSNLAAELITISKMLNDDIAQKEKNSNLEISKLNC